MSFFATQSRDEFVTRVIREKGYAVGIEVGVREGFLARHILETTDIVLHGVDLALLPSAKKLTEEFAGRYELRQAKSPGAADLYPDGFFDFVHIDADHSYEGAAADLTAWWPKLKPGGYFSGDDYCDADNPGEGKYGVVRAVNEFADALGLELFVVGAGNDRAAQLAFARDNGEKASRYLRGARGVTFHNPCWYIFRGESLEQPV